MGGVGHLPSILFLRTDKLSTAYSQNVGHLTDCGEPCDNGTSRELQTGYNNTAVKPPGVWRPSATPQRLAPMLTQGVTCLKTTEADGAPFQCSKEHSVGQLEWLHFAFGLLDIFTGWLVSIASVNHGQFGGASHEIPPDVTPFAGFLAVTGTSRLHT